MLFFYNIYRTRALSKAAYQFHFETQRLSLADGEKMTFTKCFEMIEKDIQDLEIKDKMLRLSYLQAVTL